MELFESLLQAFYTLFVQFLNIWPLALLLAAAYFLPSLHPEAKNRSKRIAVETFTVIGVLIAILIGILVIGDLYGAEAAMPYQKAGVGLYYLVLVLWGIRTILFIRKNRNKSLQNK